MLKMTSKHLKNQRTFVKYAYSGTPDHLKLACRNYRLFKTVDQQPREVAFRVYFRLSILNGEAHPAGVMSFEGDSVSDYRRPMHLEGPRMATNFGLNERGFRHLIAYCQVVFCLPEVHSFTLDSVGSNSVFSVPGSEIATSWRIACIHVGSQIVTYRVRRTENRVSARSVLIQKPPRLPKVIGAG